MAEFKKIIQSLGLFIASAIACCLFLAVSAIPGITTMSKFTPTPTGITITDTPIFPATFTPIAPTLAPEIIIFTWRDQRPKCIKGERKWVEITGLEITGGSPPYRINVKQEEKTLSNEILEPKNSSLPFILEFKVPFIVVTGIKANVTIQSSTSDGKPELITELYFEVKDKNCETSDDN